MNPLHDWRWTPLSLLTALVVTSASCSESNDSGPAAAPASAADAGDDADEPTLEGMGAACTPQTHEVLATKVSLDVNWPGGPGTMSCASPDGCKGSISLWLLSQFDISGHMGSGVTTMCGNETPTITLTALGAQGEGVQSGTASVSIQFPPSVWDAVAMNPSKPPVPAVGVFGGWNVGASFKVDPTVAFFGLKSSSPLASASATWPASEMAIPAADLSDDDNDGHAGITATPLSTGGNSLPATALSTSPPYAPKADKLYVVLRTELSMYGLATSCSDISGTARVALFNDHVIGCHVQGGDDCTQAQWDFIDLISPVYVGAGVTIPASVQPPSFAPAGITGTFKAKVLSHDPKGGGIDCAAVRAALP
jgi:hypothetical protein